MSRKQGKVKWTERMNSDLLEYKRKAKDLISSVDPLRNATGRKKGYIGVMVDLWEEKGYGYLGLKSQNLRDQATRLEKMEQEQNHTRNTSTLFESGNWLELSRIIKKRRRPRKMTFKLTCETFKTIAINSSLKMLIPLSRICISQ